jgi:hypothetical protein
MASRLFAVLSATGESRELALVAAQAALVAPRQSFRLESC